MLCDSERFVARDEYGEQTHPQPGKPNNNPLNDDRFKNLACYNGHGFPQRRKQNYWNKLNPAP